MKKLVFATMLSAGLLAFCDDVATLESNLKSDIMSKVNQVNPIDSATGQRKYISFAMISDIHKCKRVPGDDATTNPVTTYWYETGGCLTEAEQSIRLLGSLAVDAGLDAVINGGDLSTAPIQGGAGRLTVDEYTNEIWNVKAIFNQHLPASVPLFTVDGNHDRHYKTNTADIEMITSDSDWAYVLTNFNTSASVAHAHGVDVTYHRDLANAKLGDNVTGSYTGNSYHLDFRRLLASGGSNVRIACVNMYDEATGANPAYRVYDAAQFYDASGSLYDAALTPENTVIGMVAHGSELRLDGTLARTAAGSLMNGFMNGYSNAKDKIGPWNCGTQGKAFFGLVAAHQHFVNTKELTDDFDNKVNGDNKVYASAVSVSRAYAVNCPSNPNKHQLGTDKAYHFSIFVVDTDNNLLHEVRVGGLNNADVPEVPVVQLYNTNIRTHLDQSAQTAPTLGTVTVTPAVTNATISGAISSLGSGATACDVYLAYGTSANNLGAATKIAEGATASFNYVISNLTAETTYYYSLSISNNAETVMGAAKSGNFTTGAEAVEPGPEPEPGEAIQPRATASATCETIQAAIDAAAILSPAGTVVLSNGLFEIDAQLMVTGGVTLVGQGWDKTVVKYVGTKDTANSHVATVNDGSTLSHMAITGGAVKNQYSGGGVHITDGTISWCCVTNNYTSQSTGGGIGIWGTGTVKIDHTIVANNSAGTQLAAVGGGIGMRPGAAGLQVEIDACLVYGNSVGSSSCGAGVGIMYKKIDDGSSDLSKVSVTIRNTTIANNTVAGSGKGGGLYTTQTATTLRNCIVSGNTAPTDSDVAYLNDTVSSAVVKSGCLVGGSPAFVDASNGDYHLSSGSPAIAAGATYAGIGNDLDDKAFGATPSIGCYEADGSTPPAPQHEHTWGAATYVWSAGNATCTGSAICTVDSTHVTNETVTATYAVVQAATTEAAGTGRYTATFSGAPFATQTKDVTIPKLNPEPQPGEGILPGETASATRQTIQNAIDAAAPTHGTVTLGEGLFEIDAQLMVTGGVTLVGQGWDKTVVKQVAQTPAANTRVMTIEGGATVKYVTMTGGRLNNSTQLGGGAFVTDGTVSWCCISNNSTRTHHGGGIGVYGKGSVKVDHSIIAWNTAGSAYPDGVGGGIGVRGQTGLSVEIDTCLVYGNTAGASGRTSHGGGIGIIGKAATDHYTTIIRNTTVANNQTVGNGLGGGFYTDQSQTTLANCIFADNTSESSDGNVVLSSDTVSNAVALLTSNCLFGNGTVAFGSSAVGVAGSAGFVSAENGDYHLSSGSPAIGAGATYVGIGNDLDDKAFGENTSIGCNEYGDYDPPPAGEWDIPGASGGINGLDDGNGGKCIAFTSVVRNGGTLVVGIEAAKINANGQTFGLVCKDNLDDADTFVLNAVLADDGSGSATVATLQTTTDKTQLFVFGICEPVNE